MAKWNEGQESITQAEHISPAKTGDNVEAKKVVNYVWDGSNWQRSGQPNGAKPNDYDYFSIDTTGTTTDVITYKTGGSGGTTVATQTITYTDSTKANVSSVAWV